MQKSSTKYEQTELNHKLKGLIIHYNQVEHIPKMQRQFNTHKFINVIHQTNRKDKNDMIISTDAEFYQMQYTVMIKTLDSEDIEGMYLRQTHS